MSNVDLSTDNMMANADTTAPSTVPAPTATKMSPKVKKMIIGGVALLVIIGIVLAIALPLAHKNASEKATVASSGAGNVNKFGAAPAPNLPAFTVNVQEQTYKLSVHTSCARPGVIAITFDDGPSQYTEPILDALKAHNMPATFFIVGSNVAAFPNALTRMVAEGHTLASHTFTHANLSALSSDQITSEMTQTSNAIRGVIGKEPIFMRPPYLEISDSVHSQLSSMGFIPITINQDTKDYETPEPVTTGVHPIVAFYQTMLPSINKAADNVLVLEHDIVHSTQVYINDILNMIATSGLTPVTMEDCLGVYVSYR